MSDDFNDQIDLDDTPTGQEEADDTFGDPGRERQENDNKSRVELKEQAIGIVQTWVGFIIVLTVSQIVLPHMGFGLTQGEFIAVVTTTTASILGLWIVIGRGLYNGKP